MSYEDCLMNKGMASTFYFIGKARHKIYILDDPLAGWESVGAGKEKAITAVLSHDWLNDEQKI